MTWRALARTAKGMGHHRIVALVCVALLLVSGRAAAKGCVETSDIVGYEHCTRFGNAWSAEGPQFVFSFEMGDSLFDPTGRSFDFKTCKSCPQHSFSGAAFGPHLFEVKGIGAHVDYFFYGPLYAGARFWSLQMGTNAIGSVVTDDGVHLGGSDSSFTFAWFPSAALGVRIPLGRVSLRLEGSVGGEILSVSQSTSDGQSGGSTGLAWLLGTRGIVDVWATPNVTMSVYAGTNLLDSSERTMGLLFGFHLRSFDGAFALW